MSELSKHTTFYLSPPHTCAYHEDRSSSSLFMDPEVILDEQGYSVMLQQGFRRSGNLVYRPHCENCHACIAVRIPVLQFKATRAQKRTLKRNRDLVIYECPTKFNAEHFDLYQRYQHGRHRGGGMDDPDPGNYTRFLCTQHCQTRFIEFRADNKLLAIAVTDYVSDALSAVYTFFDPDEAARSLGTQAILWQIEHARELGLTHLYLGYWINDCQKMTYKTRFQPLELYVHDRWSQA